MVLLDTGHGEDPRNGFLRLLLLISGSLGPFHGCEFLGPLLLLFELLRRHGVGVVGRIERSHAPPSEPFVLFFGRVPVDVHVIHGDSYHQRTVRTLRSTGRRPRYPATTGYAGVVQVHNVGHAGARGHG